MKSVQANFCYRDNPNKKSIINGKTYTLYYRHSKNSDLFNIY